MEGPGPVGAGDRAHFALSCPGETVTAVSWHFGEEDGPTLDLAGNEASHVYRRPGHYLVTARPSHSPFLSILNQAVVFPATSTPPTASGTLLFDKARGRVWVVNADNNSVSFLAGPDWKLVREIPVGRNPRTLAQSAAGDIWVVNQDDASLTVLDGAGGEPRRTLNLPRGSRPYGIAMDPEGRTAYVTLEGLGLLVRMDARSGSETGRVAVGPTPRALAVSGDGRRILVGRFLSPSDRGEVTEVAAASLIRTRTFALAPDPGPDTEAGSRGIPNAIAAIAITPDGRQALVASKKDNTGRGTFLEGQDLTFETTVRAIVSSLDLEGNAERAEARKDFNDNALPSALAFTRLGDYVFAAMQASNHVVIYDGLSGENFASITPSGSPSRLSSQLAPDGLVLAGDSLLFVHYFMSRELGVFDVSRLRRDNGNLPRLALEKTVRKEALAPEVLLGKRIFYNSGDDRMAASQYMSCVVCHMDGGGDGRIWDFTGRGEGLRRTTSLLARAGTGLGPLHWSANFDEVQDFEHDIRGPFRGTGFLREGDFLQEGRNKPLGGTKAGLSPELDALAAYLASLGRARPSPYRNPDGSMTSDALRGKALFERADVGCARCHVPPHYTDSRLPGSHVSAPLDPSRDILTPEGFLLHDVGTLKPSSGKRLADTLKGLDTPTLLGIWEGPPYLHDGSAGTLLDVLTSANPKDRHGRTSHLSPPELAQLSAFLMQLDGTGTLPDAIRPPAPAPVPGSLAAVQSAGGRFLGFRLTGSGPPPLSILTLHDLGGRRMATLHAGAWRRPNGSAPAGEWYLPWPEGVGETTGLPPGIYLVRPRGPEGLRPVRILLPGGQSR